MRRQIIAAAVFSGGSFAARDCKCFPGDACWPSAAEWDKLNSTVGGRLIATAPLARVCHDPSFNATKCNHLKTEWGSAAIHMADSSSIMSPYFANQTCDPFTPRTTPCTPGNSIALAVAASSPADVAATLAFAHTHNLRLVVRNTGHDYLGRSTGAGALAVWTHALKNISFTSWADAAVYTGPAARLGAGIQGYDILAAVRGRGVVVVGGECPTVGPVGGYMQGGGHSALSTAFGLGADNVLEWEVVLANGTFVRASRGENGDLYWALSGGGAGNWGVVVGATVRAFPDARIGAASLIFSTFTESKDRFWKAVDAFHAALPQIVDAGSMVVYDITSQVFLMAPLTAYNKTEAEVRAIMAPFLKTLDGMNITYIASFNESTSYYDHYSTYFGPLPFGSIKLGVDSSQGRVGGRLVPRGTNVTALGVAARTVSDAGAAWVGVATNVSRFGGAGQNAVLPAWRDTLVHVILTTPLVAGADGRMPNMFSESAGQDVMTQKVMPAMERATPGGAAYMNEADFRQPHFQEEFYGKNYERLLGIKKAVDPDGFFYAVKAVGSEVWDVGNDGRMCRVAV